MSRPDCSPPPAAGTAPARRLCPAPAGASSRRWRPVCQRRRAAAAGAADAAGRPAQQARHAVAAVVQRGLLPAHAGVVHRLAGGGAVVGHEHQDGVVVQVVLVQEPVQPRQVLVDAGDHGEEAGVIGGHLATGDRVTVGIAVVVGDPQRPVRSVGGEVGEERVAGARAAPHPGAGLLEPHVGAVAAKLLHRVAMAVDVVEVIVAVVVGGRGDPPARVPDRFLEAAVLRPVGVVVAEVPLAEMPGAVAVGGEDVGGRGQVGTQQRAPHAHEGGAVAQRVDTGHQLAARRGAHRAHVEVGEAHALRLQPVQCRGAQHRVAGVGEVAVPLVVGENEDDVGPCHGCLRTMGGAGPKAAPAGDGAIRCARGGAAAGAGAPGSPARTPPRRCAPRRRPGGYGETTPAPSC